MTTTERLEHVMQRLEAWAENAKTQAAIKRDHGDDASADENMHANYSELLEHLESVRVAVVLGQTTVS